MLLILGGIALLRAIIKDFVNIILALWELESPYIMLVYYFTHKHLTFKYVFRGKY